MSDYFKIVQTVENGVTKLTVVPCGWENNGLLYWPPTGRYNNSVTDPTSKPDNSWRKFPCKVKRKGYVTYEDANEELDRMAGKSDTDDGISINPKPRRMVKRQNVFVDNFQDLMSSNNNTASQTMTPAQKKGTVFCQSTPMSSSQIVILENREIIPPIRTAQADHPSIHDNASFLNTSTDPLLDVISFEPEQLEMQSADFTLPNQNTGGFNEIMEKLESKFNERRETDEKIFRSLARLEAKIDALAHSFPEKSIAPTPAANILEPIKTIDEAITFEEALKDDVYFQKIVNQMKIKLSRNLRSFNCCYSLVDMFFDRSFFNLCSWSGQSRSKGVDKYAFKSFRRILNCFFHCVRSVDNEFTFGDCESFFKERTLKHSVQREKANSGRLSRIKHRPTGIPKKSKIIIDNNSDSNNKENQEEIYEDLISDMDENYCNDTENSD